ncbi:MAG TPA: ribonuclease R [Bacteroidetes bacterium]|nr:ribonuclease R [Bacteroidota bacterium]
MKKKFSKPKQKNRTKKRTQSQLQKDIFYLLKRNPTKKFNPKQIAKKLQVKNSKDSVNDALDKLIKAGKARALGDYKFMLQKKSRPTGGRGEATGTVDVTRTGTAYIECEGRETDVFVSANNLGTAMHGDLVKIKYWVPRGRRKPEGEVIKVLERASESFVGTLHLLRQHALVEPTRIDVNMDVFVDPDKLKGAENGDRVVVKITAWPKHPRGKAKGEITAVLGTEGSDLEMNTILINAGFNLTHDEATIAEANAYPAEITESEIKKRRDFRGITTFTIDPEDAKDFDDAISIQFLENGNVELGVHIADVTHFVKPGSALDKEAYKRSTSVYLVDRVLPMLPERLSNELCSLRPHEDRLTFSAAFEFDKNNKVVNRWFGKAIIHSDRRFAYEGAQVILEGGEGEFSSELKLINKMAKDLRKKRFKHGAIDFDMEEVRFRLDEEGVPIEVYVKERKDAHMLIEEYMLLANREVATFINKKAKGQAEIPFIYRIHDTPNPEKVAELAKFAKELGFEMNISSPKAIGKSFNKLVEAAETDGALRLLQPLAIRTMAKAAYSAENIGHYGLGFDYYSHFTSPIRRYSDVLAHRILEKNLGSAAWRTDKGELEEMCKHISAQERKAMDAERQSIKYKQVEFMEKHVGEVFDGYVSGIIDRGIFVELKANKCEGMVGFDTINEPFDIADGRLSATGKRSGQVLKMGDSVKVKILKTDLARRQIEMELVEG